MSAIPAFLDALVPKLTAAPGMGDVQVVDGPPIDYLRPDVIAVGVSTEDLSVESETADAGLRARRERVDVTCLARSWTGDADLAPRRVRAFAMVTAVETVLADDPTVGGSVTRARLTSAVYTPVRNREGVGAFVEFRIQVDAFR